MASSSSSFSLPAFRTNTWNVRSSGGLSMHSFRRTGTSMLSAMKRIFVLTVFLLGFVECAPGTQIDAVVLDELLREIVDSSMSDLRHRLQEAVFATAFRRRIQQHASSATPSISFPSSSSSFASKDSKEISAIDKLLDDYIKPQKLSLALETFTTTTPRPVQLVTADDVTFQEGSGDPLSVRTSSERLFDDAFKDSVVPSSSSSSFSASLPRVPGWVALIVSIACILTFFLLIGTIVYFISQKRSGKRQNFQMMPDPLTVQRMCHTTSSGHIRPLSIVESRRNSFVSDQDRAASSIWVNSQI